MIKKTPQLFAVLMNLVIDILTHITQVGLK